jgi:glycosyltransferase involved in cell wall biosynthesis
MHVLFVHKNFPAQFGHIAAYLIKQKGYRCTFVSETPPGMVGGIQKIQYHPAGGANDKTLYLTRTFENATAHAAGVYEALKGQVTRLRPDLIVGHSGFGSTLFLPELFPAAPMINYFEYFYHPHNSDMDFRPEWPVLEEDVLRARTRNAMILLDMEYCRAGYSPTEYQASLLPAAYRPKVRVIHDGIDTDFWQRRAPAQRAFGPYIFSPETRIVTYVSRGFESMRGFDIFMRAAKKIYTADPRVVFLIVGSDRVCYGGDMKFIPDKSFKDFILRQDDYDMKRLLFLGSLKPADLVQVLSLSDLHFYLTVPFVLSWSLLDALACGCTVLASDTAPVREFIHHGQTGLLQNFFDVDGFVATALQVLKDPAAYRHLGQAGAALIRERYSLEKLIPRMTDFYDEVAGGGV